MLNINIKKLEIKTNEKKLVDISFEIKDSTALIGESGSGKSLTLKALLNLLPSSFEVKKDIDSILKKEESRTSNWLYSTKSIYFFINDDKNYKSIFL